MEVGGASKAGRTLGTFGGSMHKMSSHRELKPALGNHLYHLYPIAWWSPGREEATEGR